ncbi:hypothetical protein [Bacteroides intestinalis]|uniref:Uncharacterized protein n=1 Tax=Bacteroides intestinalis TaxID=329854 RepID=A0A139LPH2_9BACE|nr:hypothetical protein [Bacteroides intestinalis]KXT53360.1 hypothetical protein HMPREF2531_01400 [Bacteroides intestinalis]
MLYEDLNKISLSRFIDIFLGNIDKVIVKGQYSQKEKEEASEKLCNEYLSIVGGKDMQALINKRNEILKIHMRMCCFERCSLFMELGEWDEVRNIMDALGYSFKDSEHDKMRSRIESVSASDKYRLAKLQEHSDNSGRTKMDREYFIRERVAVMSHIKMHIDENTFSAKEYAYLVKNMCEEINAKIRSTKSNNRYGK